MSDTNKFTTQEQIRLVNGATFFGTGELPEKDIPRLQMLDGGTGINFEQLFGDFLSVAGREGIGGDAIRNVLKYFYTPEQLPDEESKELYEWILEKLSDRFFGYDAAGMLSAWNFAWFHLESGGYKSGRRSIGRRGQSLWYQCASRYTECEYSS